MRSAAGYLYGSGDGSGDDPPAVEQPPGHRQESNRASGPVGAMAQASRTLPGRPSRRWPANRAARPVRGAPPGHHVGLKRGPYGSARLRAELRSMGRSPSRPSSNATAGWGRAHERRAPPCGKGTVNRATPLARGGTRSSPCSGGSVDFRAALTASRFGPGRTRCTVARQER